MLVVMSIAHIPARTRKLAIGNLEKKPAEKGSYFLRRDGLPALDHADVNTTGWKIFLGGTDRVRQHLRFDQTRFGDRKSDSIPEFQAEAPPKHLRSYLRDRISRSPCARVHGCIRARKEHSTTCEGLAQVHDQMQAGIHIGSHRLPPPFEIHRLEPAPREDPRAMEQARKGAPCYRPANFSTGKAHCNIRLDRDDAPLPLRRGFREG